MSSPHLEGSEQTVAVKIADLAVTNRKNALLTTHSLGSCLGIAIYDPVARVGGMLHAMLPSSAIEPGKARIRPAMFIDSGVEALFRAAIELKAEESRMLIYVAGGAQAMGDSTLFSIGKQNRDALDQFLKNHSLKIQAQEVGGLVNRTLSLNVGTGSVALKVSGQAQETYLCRNSTTS